ncbi:MAG: histidine phosphatase family protein [Pyrinomonadaceae bacterium]|nr:histidine phosphatase family protein [Pyrinomonadaceae bacterium]
MKTLYLMRHAKSSWDNAGLADHDRPLNDRGRRDATFMGGIARERAILPEIIVCSTAERARQTEELFCSSAGFDGVSAVESRIYEASVGRLAEIVSVIGPEFGTAMLIGHNPGMEGLIYYLTGSIEPMPTAAIAVIELRIGKWADIDAGSGQLAGVLRPKQLIER